MTDESKPAATAAPKPKYDPKGQYVARKSITHPRGLFSPPAKGEKTVTFNMSHRSPEEVEYLVDVDKAIAPA